MKPKTPKLPADQVIEGWLSALGLRSPCEWDTLVFLYRYHTSLVSAEQIARVLGQDTNAVIATVAGLESLRLVKRSRTSQGVRLYQLTAPSDPGHGRAFDELMSIAGSRSMRLFLAKRWSKRGTTQQAEHPASRVSGRRERWLKVK